MIPLGVNWMEIIKGNRKGGISLWVRIDKNKCG